MIYIIQLIVPQKSYYFYFSICLKKKKNLNNYYLFCLFNKNVTDFRPRPGLGSKRALFHGFTCYRGRESKDIGPARYSCR